MVVPESSHGRSCSKESPKCPVNHHYCWVWQVRRTSSQSSQAGTNCPGGKPGAIDVDKPSLRVLDCDKRLKRKCKRRVEWAWVWRVHHGMGNHLDRWSSGCIMALRKHFVRKHSFLIKISSTWCLNSTTGQRLIYPTDRQGTWQEWCNQVDSNQNGNACSVNFSFHKTL